MVRKDEEGEVKMLKVRPLLAAVAAAFLSAASFMPFAHAGKSAVTGTIDLSASVTASFAGPAYGGDVSFLTSVSGKLSRHSRVYVTVVCLQEGNVVYQWSADPGFTFPLEDQAGQGLEWDGGDADCSATLVYREQKGKNTTIQFLDDTLFAVNGSVS
jgi:hypothetical protein